MNTNRYEQILSKYKGLRFRKGIEEKIHKKPILLLDDVLSELDQIRQQKLIEMVHGPYQCLITSTDIPVALRNIVGNEYIVKQGKILKKGRTCNE